jgi:hypothetical protein
LQIVFFDEFNKFRVQFVKVLHAHGLRPVGCGP